MVKHSSGSHGSPGFGSTVDFSVVVVWDGVVVETDGAVVSLDADSVVGVPSVWHWVSSAQRQASTEALYTVRPSMQRPGWLQGAQSR